MKRKVEIEGKEEVMMPNGKSFTAQGPSHENGGIPIELPVGSRVYSKRIKKDGKTMAERKQRRDANLRRMVDGAMDNPFDGPAEQAMRRMMSAYAKQEAEDMDIQERTQKKKEAEQTMDSFSSPDEMKCGGKVKKYKKGGTVDPPGGSMADQMAREMYNQRYNEGFNSLELIGGFRPAPNVKMRLDPRGGTPPTEFIGAGSDSDSALERYNAWNSPSKVVATDGPFGSNSPMDLTIPEAQSSKRGRFKMGGKVKKYAKGGTIEIDPAKKGTFKAQATKMGMGVQEAADYILGNPDDFTPKMRKKANFAKNFAMAYGGQVMGYKMEEGGEVEEMEIEDVLNAMIDERIKAVMGGQPEGEEPEEEEGEDMEGMAEEEAPEMTEEEMAMYGMKLGYGAKVMGMGGMIRRADGSMSQRGLWDNIRANKGSGKKPTKEMLRQEKKIRAAEKMEDGGVVKNGTTKRSDNKGKKMAVFMDGSWHHFGDSSMDDFRTHKSEKRKEAFYSRHKKNLQGDDARSKAFRVYARKTWENGGVIPMYQNGVAGIPPQDPYDTYGFMLGQRGIGPMGYISDVPNQMALDTTPMNTGAPITLGAPAGSVLPTSNTVPTETTWQQGVVPPPAAPARQGTRLGNAISTASQFVGQNMGPLGIAVGTLGPLAATIINRIGDKTNESFYEDYGRQGLAANARAMRGVEAGRQQAMGDIGMQTANAAAQARGTGSINAARGVQQMAGAQAMRASTTANQQAVGQQAGLMGERAGLLNNRDQMVMSGREQADLANVQDRDAFFTNLTSNLTNLGTGMLYAAKNRKPTQTAAQVINKKVLG